MDLMTAVEVIRAPLTETQLRLSAAFAEAIPHRTLAQLAANCPFAPFKTHGESPGAPGSSVTIADLAAIRPLVPARGTWQGRATMAGVEVPVLALASDATEQGALLVLVRTEDTPVPEEDLVPALAIWDMVTAHREGLRNEAAPEWLAVSRAASAARAVAIADLGDAHGATLTALLGVLRDRSLGDADARTRAIDLAVTALLELRSRAELDHAMAEERVGDAFDRLAESLSRILRPRGVVLELGTPGAEEGADRVLPADVAATARAVVRAIAHVMLDDQRQARRIHVGWKLGNAELRATVRDDGPGTLSRSALAARRVEERLGALGGRLEVDAVPGWGTTVTVEVPLGPPETPRDDPLTVLGARELEVLGQLARGRRNREIARELHISESTVKFHVAKILEKLGVGSRGEAAALAHEWGAATTRA
ncbi:LuxR C-terminal-related transcriptional regulator [Actinomycetes bacterium KLBMP 9797]